MTLHPQAAAFLNLLAGNPPLETISPEENRNTTRKSIPLTGEPTQLAAIEDLTLDIVSGTVPVRVYWPSHETGLAVTTYFHGGGG
jgi:acetyl esterase